MAFPQKAGEKRGASPCFDELKVTARFTASGGQNGMTSRTETQDKIERFGVSMPSDLLKQFDERIRRQGYNCRSEAIRDMVRECIVEGDMEEEDAQVVGTATIVYDHHASHLMGKLTDIQHTCEDVIICTTHVHLDSDHCLEVIVMKGTVRRLKDVSDKLISAKGVKHGKLVYATTGHDLP